MQGGAPIFAHDSDRQVLISGREKGMKNKLTDRRGLSRAAGILIIIIAVLLVAVGIPVYIHLQSVYREMDCMAAMKSANDQLRIAWITSGEGLDPDEAKQAVAKAMDGWDDLCPGGGTPHLAKFPDSECPYKVVCGIHDSDTAERTRLNAEYVLDRLRYELKLSAARGVPYPETLTVNLNGKPLEAKATDKNTNIKRGTYSTPGYEGTVCFYAVKGAADFSGGTNASDGTIFYFCYADDDHCASWTADRGWYGDSWGSAD